MKLKDNFTTKDDTTRGWEKRKRSERELVQNLFMTKDLFATLTLTLSCSLFSPIFFFSSSLVETLKNCTTRQATSSSSSVVLQRKERKDLRLRSPLLFKHSPGPQAATAEERHLGTKIESNDKICKLNKLRVSENYENEKRERNGCIKLHLLCSDCAARMHNHANRECSTARAQGQKEASIAACIIVAASHHRESQHGEFVLERARYETGE